MLTRRTGGLVLALFLLVFVLAASVAAAMPREPFGSHVERAQARAAVQRAPHFPVVGGASFGEGQAAFGAGRSGHVHEGQDVFAPAGTPLVAVTSGTVLETGNDGGRGNYVGFYSARTNRTYVYMHMQSPARVRPGRHVASGQRVGELGCTGSCFGDHLHFEERRGKGLQAPAQNPLPLLRRLLRR